MPVPEGTTRDTVHPSRFLKAEDVNKRDDKIYTVMDTSLEVLGEKDESKLVLSFREIPKGLVMNQTNWKNIEKIYGKDPNGYIGKRVKLYTTFVDFMGESVEAVRIEPRIPEEETSSPPAEEPIP